MKRLIFIGIFASLAACGVDGEPNPPEPKAQPGLTISGAVETGVSGTL